MKKNKKAANFSNNIVQTILKTCHINVSEKTEHLLIQIFKFGIVGVVATIIDFAFLYFFRDLCNFPLLVSNTLSFIISLMYNYWASMTFVFDINKEKDKKKNFILFVVFSIIGLGINNLIVWIGEEVLHIYYLLGKVLATAIVMIFNFITRKKFLE